MRPVHIQDSLPDKVLQSHEKLERKLSRHFVNSKATANANTNATAHADTGVVQYLFLYIHTDKL